MQEKDIDVGGIVVTDNPRTVREKEPLDELVQSVREKGILQPLLVKELPKGKYELIAGSRRLEAAKTAGLEKVPARILEKTDDEQIAEIQLVENIHREDLSPVEEGIAFRQYIKKTKVSADTLAKKICKPLLYVERRLQIADLDPEIQKSIEENKITMGHALAVARLSDIKEQKAILKEISRDGMSVKETLRQIQWGNGSKDLSRAQFDRNKGPNGKGNGDTGCKGCPYNGGEQALLFDTGSQLKGTCLNPKCYAKKTEEWLQAEKNRLTDQGVNVLSPKKAEERKDLRRIRSWDEDLSKTRRDMKKHPENYAVAYEDCYNSIEQQIYRIKGAGKSKKNASEEEIKERQRRAKEKLKTKMELFKRDFLIENNQCLMKPDSRQAKALTLISLLFNRFYQEGTEEMLTGEGVKLGSCFYYENSNKRLYRELNNLDERTLDKLICRASCWRLTELNQQDLVDCAVALETTMSRYFTITEEFLKLHTKDQLIDLSREIGLAKFLNEKDKNWIKGKRIDLIDAFLTSGFKLEGIVPRSMALPKENAKAKR